MKTRSTNLSNKAGHKTHLSNEVNMNRTINVKQPKKMKFYTLTLSLNDKLELNEGFEGKIWFSEFNASKGRILKMYCTEESAENMKSRGEVTPYEPLKANPDKDEISHTLIIPITNLLKYNTHLQKRDIYASIKHTLYTINSRFGLSVEKFIDMHVSIMLPNERYPISSGKVFINFDELCSVDVIATLKELITGMYWSIDINDISGYTHYIQCFYSIDKKNNS